MLTKGHIEQINNGYKCRLKQPTNTNSKLRSNQGYPPADDGVGDSEGHGSKHPLGGLVGTLPQGPHAALDGGQDDEGDAGQEDLVEGLAQARSEWGEGDICWKTRSPRKVQIKYKYVKSLIVSFN